MAALQSGSKPITTGGELVVDGGSDIHDIWIGVDSGKRVYLGIGKAAVANEGIFIDPGFQAQLGGGIQLKSIRGPINAITASGTAVVTFQELN